MPNLEPDPISEPLRQLLSLFQTRLSEVQFPGIDGATLAKLSETVGERAAAVTLAQAQVEAARTELRDAQSRLAATARQAHAYALVYAQAEDDPDLAQRLAALRLTDRAAAPRKRRPRKAAKAAPEPATAKPAPAPTAASAA